MATIGNVGAVTLLDLARRLEDDKVTARIVEMLSVPGIDDVLGDMLWMEGNLLDGHKTTVRTGLPPVTWRLLNYGVAPGKSTTKQVVDTTGMLECFAVVDEELVALNGNEGEWRLSEDKAFIEAMKIQVVSTLFYGDTRTNPERFVGLAPRYNSLSTNKTKSGYNVIDAGGRSAAGNTSIWVVNWGSESCFGIYPKGTHAGIEQKDLGLQTIYNNTLGAVGSTMQSGEYLGYKTHYKWKVGLCLRDWRCTARIANIDVAALMANQGQQAKLVEALIQADNKAKRFNLGGRKSIYMHTNVRTMFEIQTLNKPNALFTWAVAQNGGEQILHFRGTPIRTVESLLLTESPVTTQVS